MDRIVLDLVLEPGKFELGKIEASREVWDLMVDHDLNVKHYLSRHLAGDCGYLSASEHDNEVERFQKSSGGGLVMDPHSEYLISADKVLAILTYTGTPDEPLTRLGVVDIDPQNLKALNIEELYIASQTLLNQLPNGEREATLSSASQKIPA